MLGEVQHGKVLENIKKHMKVTVSTYHVVIITDFQRMLDLEPNNKQAIEELAKLEKLRSSIETKPRKKITISEVSEMQPSEVEPPTKSSKTTSVLPKNERISPEPQKNVAESTGEKIPTTKVESKKVAQADAKKPATTPVRTFQIKLEVPKEPPKTSYEFETFWRNAKNDLSTFFEYFKVTLHCFPSYLSRILIPYLMRSCLKLP